MGPLGPTGPTTRALVGLLLAVSVGAAFLQRQAHFGVADLLFDRERVLHGELWRLLTYAFCKPGSPLNLLLSALALWLFGQSFEARLGSLGLLRFFFVSTIGAALLALPLGMLCDATGLFSDRGVFGGPDAAIDAMLVAIATQAPQSPLLFGFVLPMPAKHFVWLLLALDVVGGLMTGVCGLGLTLGGMLLGYAQVTGLWRPSHAWASVRLWQMRRRRRGGLYVVPPRKRHDLN